MNPSQAAPDPRQTLKAIAWAVIAGLCLVAMNACMRVALQTLDPLVGQFFRYGFGLVLALPFMLSGRVSWLRPNNLAGHLQRGLAQTIAITLFNLALKHLPLADAVAIMFTVPIFVLLGAALFLRERVAANRWLAAAVGLAGVLIVLWPKLAGTGSLTWSLVMLSSVPFWAATFLITKTLTRADGTETIVAWQNLSITAMTLPIALLFWQTPNSGELMLTAMAGVFGTVGHWCLTRSFSMADVSAMQPVRFLDLVWSSLFGIALFGETPTVATLVGGTVVVTSTIWLARSESRARRK